MEAARTNGGGNIFVIFLLNFKLVSVKLLNLPSNPLRLRSRDFDHENTNRNQWSLNISYRKSPRKCTYTQIFPPFNERWTLEEMDQ